MTGIAKFLKSLWNPASGTDRPEQEGDPANVRRIARAGFIVIALFFGVFGAWAWLAPLDSAAIAIGTVSVETNRKTIQHLEGGLIAEILVREGDRVNADQVVVRLDATQVRASRDLLAGRLGEAVVLEARLIAERDEADEVTVPEAELSGWDSEAAGRAIKGQRGIFTSRRKTLQEREGVFRQRIAQLNEQIGGLNGQIKSENRQIALLEEELTDVRELVEKGLARRPRLLALERNLAAIEGSRSGNQASIASSKQAIGETELRISELHTLRQNEVLEGLRNVQSEIADLRERLLAAAAILERTLVRSPLDGTVVDLRVHTTGGVLRPGEAIMDIVPRNDKLVIDVRINPQDIDVVSPGLRAHVMLTALNRRDQLPLAGTLTSVSADLLQDPQTGVIYYLGRVELDARQPGLAEGPTLYPGMQAEVMIVTGDNTPLDYLLRPLTRSLRRAMRDS
jgi:HlyD family type I secretion membrane fusion protein